MRRFFAAAVGSVVALVGLAGAANASAQIDLIWAANGTNQIGGIDNPVLPSSNITLRVILTGSPAGALGTGVSVDYSAAVPSLAVLGYASTPGAPYLTQTLGTTINTGGRILNLNATAAPFAGLGIGLPPGLNAQLGTITFRNDGSPTGVFEIQPDANSPTDGVLNSKGRNITATTAFRSAFVRITGPNDFDGDGVDNVGDNCLNDINPDQDDTDGDDCGNLCDADYNQSGKAGIGDFGQFSMNFGCATIACELYQHTPPITAAGAPVGIADFGFFSLNFGATVGPSGTTAGTTACP